MPVAEQASRALSQVGGSVMFGFTKIGTYAVAAPEEIFFAVSHNLLSAEKPEDVFAKIDALHESALCKFVGEGVAEQLVQVRKMCAAIARGAGPVTTGFEGNKFLQDAVARLDFFVRVQKRNGSAREELVGAAALSHLYKELKEKEAAGTAVKYADLSPSFTSHKRLLSPEQLKDVEKWYSAVMAAGGATAVPSATPGAAARTRTVSKTKAKATAARKESAKTSSQKMFG